MLFLACAGKLPVVSIDVDGHSVRAEIAANDEDRNKGLMYRERLADDAGMLFVYPDQAIRHFWMKNTRIPLSIAFADREGVIVWIDDMEPHDTRRTSSMLPATYALEVNQGWFAEHGVEKGDKIANIPKDLDVR